MQYVLIHTADVDRTTGQEYKYTQLRVTRQNINPPWHGSEVVCTVKADNREKDAQIEYTAMSGIDQGFYFVATVRTNDLIHAAYEGGFPLLNELQSLYTKWTGETFTREPDSNERPL
jgi:hypothetical protein